MQITSLALQRKHPGKRQTHFDETESFHTKRVRSRSVNAETNIAYIDLEVLGDRTYRVTLTTDDIVEFLLELPTTSLSECVAKLRNNNFRAKIPEILKQLAAGAIGNE